MIEDKRLFYVCTYKFVNILTSNARNKNNYNWICVGIHYT